MKAFVDKYEDRIHGVLSCFDRMLFRGYLPIMSGWSMAQLLQAHEIDCGSIKPFLLSNAGRVKEHALAMAREHGRPFEYPSSKMPTEDAAPKIAERDNIDDGLVCVFSALEPCRTFSMRFATGQPYVQTAKRKCLHLYYYFMDRDLGLLHVRVQTWFPLQVQIYLNGHEWLARKLDARGIEHAKIDNVFIRTADGEGVLRVVRQRRKRAQVFVDRGQVAIGPLANRRPRHHVQALAWGAARPDCPMLDALVRPVSAPAATPR
jgi:hypothetical protein